MCNNRYDTSVRLWDAVGGFLFLFANMQDKLSKHSSQLDLLKELLNLQKDMVIMMLSMLEGKIIFFYFFWFKLQVAYISVTKGNVVNGTIGKQMVDTLVESASNVEVWRIGDSYTFLYLNGIFTCF